MTGRRLPDHAWPARNLLAQLKPGDYVKVTGWPEGFPEPTWYICAPNGCGAWRLIGKNHTWTEHEDGTVSFNPSISLVRDGHSLFHGHLTRGVWSQC